MINKKRLIRLAQDLLRVNSENPPGNEKLVAHFAAKFLKKSGLSSRIVSFHRDRDNVVAVLLGSRAKMANKPLLITPHLDTVPAGAGWKFNPFSGTIKAGKIYGRGASDCKGNLAVAMEVMASLIEDDFKPKNDIIFLATADEETGSGKGLIPFLNKNIFKLSHALILDADGFDIITAQKGLMHFKIIVKGKKAHGAYPERGVNAIDHACKLISCLKNIQLKYSKHKLLKAPTINIGTIHGGDKVNMVADWCEFEVDLRFLPGMDAQRILSKIRAAFVDTGIDYKIKINDIQVPYEISESHLMVKALKEASWSVSVKPEVKGSEGATVITFFKKKGIPAIATGYGVKGTAHATDEYVRVNDLYRGALVLERFIKLFDQKCS